MMKFNLSVFACALFLFSWSAEAEPRFSLQISQDDKAVTADTNGITHLRKAPFTIVFEVRDTPFKICKTSPVIRLHLSTDMGYARMLRAGKELPSSFTVGGVGMAEASPPTSKAVFVFGKLPVTLMDGNDIAGIHFLIGDRFNRCTTTGRGTTCIRIVEQLTVGSDGDADASEFLVLNPVNFPPVPIYLSAVNEDLHSMEVAIPVMSATAIIQFTK
jgi:hypothetical protein